MLEIKNLTKKFGNRVIFNNYNLKIENGEFIGIIGQSGAGKTTLLRILGLLDLNYEGQYIIDDVEVNQKKNNEKLRISKFSYILQENNLFSYLTVKENILVPFAYSNKSISNDEISDILNEIGIAGFEDKLISKLSGGEKQRIVIARCILMKSHYILADEPTGSLDYKRNHEIISLLKNISRKYNTTVIVVTHNKEILNEFNRIVEIDYE